MKNFVLIVFISSINLITCDPDGGNKDPNQWFVPPNKAAYTKGDVAFQSYNGRNGEATVNKQSVQSQVNVQGNGNYQAGRVGNQETMQGNSPDGRTVKVDQSKRNPNNGHRSADAHLKKGDFTGNLDNKKSGQDQIWTETDNRGHKMETSMKGDKKQFTAQGSEGHRQVLTPLSQNKQSGQGSIQRDGTTYNYKENRQGNGDTDAQLSNVGKDRKTYTCKAQKQGISNCVDQNGMKYGQVVSQPDGSCVVSKTIARSVDVPIAKCNVVRDKNGKATATINNGMFQGQAGNYQERDCMSDYGKQSGQKIKIEKPLSVKFNSESKDGQGRTVFQFPDCVTVGAKVTLPPGMDMARLAVQMQVMILPAGQFKCVDVGTCKEDCYYCNLCSNTKKATVSGNSDSSNVCQAKGGGTYQLTFTACPPPKAFNKAMCSGFTKSDPDYWKKQGDIQCKLIFWKRPANEKEKRDEYYNTVNNNPFSKSLLKAQYRIAKKNIKSSTPTDYALAQYYVESKGGPDECVGCVLGTTNYTMSSQKFPTKFLLEAGSLATAPKMLFDTKQCPEVDAKNQEQSQQDQQEAQKGKPASNNKFGNWGNFNWGG